MARKLFARKTEINLKNVAAKSWDIAPGETTVSPPAIFLPGQLERVSAWEARFPFEHPARTMHGRLRMDHGPTRGHLIKDVWLIDGALYKGNASLWLSLNPTKLPRIVVDTEIERGAAYCTQNGNTWFGTWLMEDCVTYALACNEGVPVTTAPSARFPIFSQAPAYENWLGMKPVRLRSAFFRELVLFDDLSNNRSRHLRYRAMGEKLLSHVNYASHPGVFILRGGDGDLRLLRNEIAIAEHLHKTRGFRILDPLRTDVPTIVATCAGARVVMGLRGASWYMVSMYCSRVGRCWYCNRRTVLSATTSSSLTATISTSALWSERRKAMASKSILKRLSARWICFRYSRAHSNPEAIRQVTKQKYSYLISQR